MIPAPDIKRRSVYMYTRVCAIRDTTPHLRCISLQHEQLKDIGAIAPGAHFKILIPRDKNAEVVEPDLSSGRAVWPDEKNKPFVRTYTVRRIDLVNGILDIEFVLHGDTGPASAWAASAAVGNSLGIGLKPSRTYEWADWYLLAGDETATPAIAAMLEALPASVTGIALVEAAAEADIFKIETHSAVEIRWLIRNGKPPEQSDLLLRALQGLALPDPAFKSRYAWIAGEENMVKATRKHATEQLGIHREELHATVYWKAGLSEDGYQKIRRRE